MLCALNALDDFVGLGLGERIEAITASWKAYAKGTYEEAASKVKA
jgi:hypothetical protein